VHAVDAVELCCGPVVAVDLWLVPILKDSRVLNHTHSHSQTHSPLPQPQPVTARYSQLQPVIVLEL